MHHLLTGLLRQSVFGHSAGYQDAKDAERRSHGPAMRTVVNRNDLDRMASSTSQLGSFDIKWLAMEETPAA